MPTKPSLHWHEATAESMVTWNSLLFSNSLSIFPSRNKSPTPLLLCSIHYDKSNHSIPYITLPAVTFHSSLLSPNVNTDSYDLYAILQFKNNSINKTHIFGIWHLLQEENKFLRTKNKLHSDSEKFPRYNSKNNTSSSNNHYYHLFLSIGALC